MHLFQFHTKAKASQLGANAVEYALVMALITSMMIMAATMMSPSIEGFFKSAAQCVAQLVHGDAACGQSAAERDRAQTSTSSDDKTFWEKIREWIRNIFKELTTDATDPARNSDIGFKSVDDAAVAFGREHGPDSVSNDEERATLIYKDKDGRYFYADSPDISQCASGASCASNPWNTQSQVPKDAELVGDVHSHGANPPGSPNAFDAFSPQDFIGIDNDTANNGGNWDGYLINPSGDVLHYEGGSGNPPTIVDQWNN